MADGITGTEGPLECGHMESDHSPVTRGYGTDPNTGDRSCYACCAEIQKATMRETGKAVLYLVKEGATHWLTDWPGTFRIKPGWVRTGGRHNGAGTRTDVWFTHEGWQWHGVQYGENTQLCHCKRTGRMALPAGPPTSKMACPAEIPFGLAGPVTVR